MLTTRSHDGDGYWHVFSISTHTREICRLSDLKERKELADDVATRKIGNLDTWYDYGRQFSETSLMVLLVSPVVSSQLFWWPMDLSLANKDE